MKNKKKIILFDQGYSFAKITEFTIIFGYPPTKAA